MILTATESSGSHTIASSITVIPSSSIASVAWNVEPNTSYTASNTTGMTSFSAQILDANGNVITGNSTTTITLSRTSGSGSLGGTVVRTVTSGVATFTGITYTKAESPVVITATENSLGNATVSSGITVSPAAASQLVFTTNPSSSSTSLIAFTVQPVVAVKDPYSNTVATSSVITLSLNGTGTLGGTLTKAASSGVADFAGLGLNVETAGTNFYLTATMGAITGNSSTFTITAGALSQIAFSTQPAGATEAVAFTAQPVIQLRDASANVVTTATDSVVMSLSSGYTGTLSGTKTISASERGCYFHKFEYLAVWHQ